MGIWYQLKITSCPPEDVERLTEVLEEGGALSITLTDRHDDPVLEPDPGATPLWPEVVIQALYSCEQIANKAQQELKATHHHLTFSITTFADQEWERMWMDDFKPQCFGKRLWICPSWATPPHPQATNLILDPGLAFGTGTHPTTSLCLSWLDQAELRGKTVIDYGCGSGILALAALKLGAAKVQAVDIDEQALQATQRNAFRNGISDKQLLCSFPQEIIAPVDLVIANILLNPLLDLYSQFNQLLKERGVLVVSGILAEQESKLISVYEADFRYHSTNNLNGWSLLVFSRLPSSINTAK